MSAVLKHYDIEMDEEKLLELTDIMRSNYRETQMAAATLAMRYNVSDACGLDILYLRSRSRHTPELEAKLVALHKAGCPPDVMEFTG